MTTPIFHFVVPVGGHSPKAAKKGTIGYSGWKRDEPQTTIEIFAHTNTSAYRLLCRTFLPDDKRPIGAAHNIGFYRENTPWPEERPEGATVLDNSKLAASK